MTQHTANTKPRKSDSNHCISSVIQRPPAPSVRKQARTYRSAGLRIMPIAMPRKQPAVPEGAYGLAVPDATWESQDFRDGQQVGILCGRVEGRDDIELLGLDRDGDIAWAELEDSLGGELPPTLSSKGDAHRFYWIPAGLDLAQRNHFVATDVGAFDPRPHSGGYLREPWEWDGGGFDVDAIVTLPPKALDGLKRLLAPKAPGAGADLPDAGVELTDAMQRALVDAAVAEWPGAGEGVHEASMALGGALRRVGVDWDSTRAIATAVLRDGGCSDKPRMRIKAALDAWGRVERGETAYGAPTLRNRLVDGGRKTLAALEQIRKPPAWVQRIAEHARTQLEAGDDVGTFRRALMAWAGLEPWDTDADAAAAVLECVSWRAIMAPLPAVDWICERLGMAVGGRPNILAAQAGVGKTLSAQALALSVASGRKLFGEFECTQGPVLHIDLDQGRGSVLNRYQLLAQGMGLKSSDAVDLQCAFFGLSLTRGDKIDADAVAKLERTVRGKTLVVLDSLRALAPGIDENASEFGGVLIELSKISSSTGATWLVIHHSGKSDGTAVRGSSAIRGAAGCIWHLTRPEGAADAPLQWRQDKVSEWALDPAPSLATTLELTPGLGVKLCLAQVGHVGGKANGAPTLDERQQIVEVVTQRRDGMSASEIEMGAGALGISRQRCRDLVKVMTSDGELDSQGKGKYHRIYVESRGRQLLEQ